MKASRRHPFTLIEVFIGALIILPVIVLFMQTIATRMKAQAKLSQSYLCEEIADNGCAFLVQALHTGFNTSEFFKDHDPSQDDIDYALMEEDVDDDANIENDGTEENTAFLLRFPAQDRYKGCDVHYAYKIIKTDLPKSPTCVVVRFTIAVQYYQKPLKQQICYFCLKKG